MSFWIHWCLPQTAGKLCCVPSGVLEGDKCLGEDSVSPCPGEAHGLGVSIQHPLPGFLPTSSHPSVTATTLRLGLQGQPGSSRHPLTGRRRWGHSPAPSAVEGRSWKWVIRTDAQFPNRIEIRFPEREPASFSLTRCPAGRAWDPRPEALLALRPLSWGTKSKEHRRGFASVRQLDPPKPAGP